MLTAMEAYLARLRSGALKQIQGKLGTVDGGRCCLGVACDVAVEYGVIPPPTVVEKSMLLAYGPHGNRGLMPVEVVEFFGFSTRGGSYIDVEGLGHSLYIDNDGFKLTFAQIADIIESRPQGLFVDAVQPAPAVVNLLPAESKL
jgi:hypothetical protein